MRWRRCVMQPPLKKLCLCFLVLLGPWGVSWAAQVTVQARLAEAEIYLGESTVLEVRIQGIREPSLPELQHPDMEISREGGQSFNNSSYAVINGQVRQIEEFGYVARYVLRPRRTGRLDITPVTITHDGQQHTSNAVTLSVRQPTPQDYLIVEVMTDKAGYVLGESVTLTLNLSLRKLIVNGTILGAEPFFQEQPPHLHIPWFESLGDWKTTDVQTFARAFLGQQRPGFAINNYRKDGLLQALPLQFVLPRQNTQRHTATGPAEYFTYQLQKQFRPVRSGGQSIPPVFVKVNLPTQVDARGRATRTEKIVASSGPLTVEVRPVPSAGQPASFSGAVGRFTLEVDARPKVLKVGDPLTVTLTLRGEGLLETVLPPPLQNQAALTQAFKLHDEPPAVKTEDNAKTFTYTLRPRHANLPALPPIEVAYFDPEEQRYRVLRSNAIPLRVDATATLDVGDVVVSTDGAPKNVLGQELAAGILANYTGPEVLIQQSYRLRLTPTLGILIVFPPLVYGLAFLWQWRVTQQRQYPERQRARKAKSQALQALQALQAQGSLSEAALCDGVHRAMAVYISDKLALESAGLTVEDMLRYLQARHLEPGLMAQVEAVLHLCDRARYAPGSLAVAQLTGLLAEATALVERLEVSKQL